MPVDIRSLEQHVNRNLSRPLHIETLTPVTGGSICRAYKVRSGTKACFLKTHEPHMYPMLQSEADNLRAIADTETLRVPHPITHGNTDTYSYLLLEFIELRPGGSSATLGRLLAGLHRHTQGDFGWHQDNWIGTAPQPNARCPDWISFWRHRRLAYQLELAKRNHACHSLLENTERLLCDFDVLFERYSPSPSLLHGDLWSGNYAFEANGRPVVYDPACYYGDRETDLAMTELFGGFSQEFYDAYTESYPLDRDYPVRKDFYNLYHIMNHFNLFGGSYAQQAEQLCLKVLSEIR